MKGMLIGCTCIILALFIWANPPSPSTSSRHRSMGFHNSCAVGPSVVTVPTPIYAYGMVLWAEWIRSPRRRRPYRNPLRRYRLTKKQRRRLRQRLRRIVKHQTRLAWGSESPLPVEEAGLDAGRCA